MKLLVLLSILFIFFIAPPFLANVCADEFENKYASYAQAHAASVKEDKPIFLMFTASWCVPCQSLKRNILYTDGIWPSLNRQFIVHLVDVDREKETVELFKKFFNGQVPTMFFLDKGGKKFTGRHVGGFDSVWQFIAWYKLVHNLK